MEVPEEAQAEAEKINTELEASRALANTEIFYTILVRRYLFNKSYQNTGLTDPYF